MLSFPSVYSIRLSGTFFPSRFSRQVMRKKTLEVEE